MSGSGSRVERPDYVKRSAEKGVCHCCHARLGTGARRGVHYRDERACCERCRASAVTRITEGRPILQRVARDLKDLAGLDFEGGQWIRLELRSQTQLVEAAAQRYARRPRGSASRIRRDGSSTYVIRALYGLPRLAFADLCAHELGHVYMFRRDFPKLDPMVEEGLCRLCQYVYLMADGSTAALARVERMWASSDPVYGMGFRAAHRALRGRRLGILIEEVQRLGRLPD